MRRSRSLLTLLLAAAVAVAGAPVHGSPASHADRIDPMAPAQVSTDHDAPTRGACPDHAEVAQPAPVDSLDQCQEPLSCCGDDCFCSCAGLSMVIPMKLAATDMPRLSSHPLLGDSLFDSLSPDTLLRPPQG